MTVLGLTKGSSTVQKRFSMKARVVKGAPDCAPHPATRHLISRMRERALHRCLATCASDAAAEVLVQEREELQRERESSRERRAGDGAG